MIRLLRDLVLVEEVKAESRIILPATSTNRFRMGKVVGTGPGKRTKTGRSACEVNKGDIVAFGETIGLTTKLDGKEYLTIVEKDIMAVIC